MSIFHRKTTKNEPILISGPQREPVATEIPAELPLKLSCNRKTIQHLKSYPLVQETKSCLGRIAMFRILVDNSKPIVLNVAQSKSVKTLDPLVRFVDNLAFNGLQMADTWIPSLKTKDYDKLNQEIMLPCRTISKVTTKATDKTLKLVDKTMYTPVHNQVLKFRNYYNAHYIDTNNRPLVRGSLDPIVFPVNNVLEKSILQKFPEGEQVPLGEYSCEFNRSLALMMDLMSRSSKCLASTTFKLALSPVTYVLHANDVLNKELDARNPNLALHGTWNASVKAGKELTAELLHPFKKKTPSKSQTQNPISVTSPDDREYVVATQTNSHGLRTELYNQQQPDNALNIAGASYQINS